MNEMNARQQFVLWTVAIIAGVLIFCILAALFYRSAEQDRDKEVHMMQACTETGGTWLGDTETCVQQRAGGL